MEPDTVPMSLDSKRRLGGRNQLEGGCFCTCPELRPSKDHVSPSCDMDSLVFVVDQVDYAEVVVDDDDY